MEEMEQQKRAELLNVLDVFRERVIEELELREELSKEARHLLDKTRFIKQLLHEYKASYDVENKGDFEATPLYKELSTYLDEVEKELKNIGRLADEKAMIPLLRDVKEKLKELSDVEERRKKLFGRFKR